MYVQGWDASALKYTELLRIDLSTLSKVALDSYFRTNQVQLIEERRQSALSVMIDDGGYHDTAATEASVRNHQETWRECGEKRRDDDATGSADTDISPYCCPPMTRRDQVLAWFSFFGFDKALQCQVIDIARDAICYFRSKSDSIGTIPWRLRMAFIAFSISALIALRGLTNEGSRILSVPSCSSIMPLDIRSANLSLNA